MNKFAYLFVFITIILAACSSNEDKVQQEIEKIEEIQTENKIEQEITEEKKTKVNKITSNDFFDYFKGPLNHVHGLGYVGNENSVFFAAHDGLKVFSNEKWYMTKGQNHDYMGFNAVKDGFFTSGHPGKGSNLPNPFGITKSTDFGETLDSIVLKGETDFHLMGVGYESHTIYVINPHRNSLLNKEGALYISENQGFSWHETSAQGLGNDIFHIAVHPTNANIVAIAGKEGIFLSQDKGENFSLLTNDPGTTVFLTNNDLYYGTYNSSANLVRYSLETDKQENLKLPNLKNDAVMYFAENPSFEDEIVFISFEGDIYISHNGSTTWKQLAEKGELVH